MGGHDPIFQKLCSLSLPLFGTNCGGDGQETIFTTKIQNKSEKVGSVNSFAQIGLQTLG